MPRDPNRLRLLSLLIPMILMLSITSVPAAGQPGGSDGAGTTSTGSDASLSQSGAGGPNRNAPLTLTLQDALERAEKYSPQFQAAVTATKMARAGVAQARSTLLPSADYTMQDLATQGNGIVPSGQICDQ